MVVVVLSDCPPKLRGDLSKWLFEINTGVYIGNVTARIRELLWKRICENIKNGQATMVYSARGEQRMEFVVHNTSWKIVDFDGIKLMQRPLPKGNFSKDTGESFEHSYSKASLYKKVEKIEKSRNKSREIPDEYVVLDVETTGLSYLTNDIIEIGAIHVLKHEPIAEFNCLVKSEKEIPESVKNVTGITEKDLLDNGCDLRVALIGLLEFISNKTIVCHNVGFDLNFIRNACRREKLEFPRIKNIDTVILAKRKLKGVTDYKLTTIARELDVDSVGAHRALRDCYITNEVFLKLNEK